MKKEKKEVVTKVVSNGCSNITPQTKIICTTNVACYNKVVQVAPHLLAYIENDT